MILILFLSVGVLTSCQAGSGLTDINTTPALEVFTLSSPVFTPSAGEHNSNIILRISVDAPANGPTPGVFSEIRYTYTTNGDEPAEPLSDNWILYTNAISILPYAGTVYHMKAISVLTGYSNSMIIQSEYSWAPSKLSSPVFTPSAGEHNSNIILRISADAPANGPTPGVFPEIRYTYTTNGDEPAEPLSDNWILYTNAISILPYAGTVYHMKAISVLTGYSNSMIIQSEYSWAPSKLSSPVFTPSAGEHNSNIILRISADAPTNGPTPGSQPNIYYTFTTDGSEPADLTSDNWISYHNSIFILEPLNSSYRIKAISVLNGYNDSSIVQGHYTRRSDSDNDGIDNIIDNCPIIVNNDQADIDNDNIGDVCDVDNNGNGLIEIATIEELYNVRSDLRGTSYMGDSNGCGGLNGVTTCKGYELITNFNFDKNMNGFTWMKEGDNYILDVDDSNTYFPISITNSTEAGWLPIGDATTPFNAIFDGNGFVIQNLAIRRDQTHIGLFGRIGSDARIRNLEVKDALADYTGDNFVYIGVLVGYQSDSIVSANHVTGSSSVDGGAGGDYIGALVGYQERGSIIANYATGSVNGGDGIDRVGGLVGYQGQGSIIANYATGSVDGGSGGNDFVGGLLGQQNGGDFAANYAIGSVNGGAGNSDHVGGLVGNQAVGTITASYATGSVDGGAGSSDFVGILLGTGGFHGANITASYGFGSATMNENTNAFGLPPTGVTIASDITSGNAGSVWNDFNNNTSGAWDFTMRATANGGGPALRYADYDGTGGVNYCSLFPMEEVVCGTTLLPSQR